MFLIIILYCLFISFILSYFFGYYFGKKGSNFITMINVILSILVTIIYFLNNYIFSIEINKVMILKLGNWFSYDYLTIDYNFIIDGLSMIMIIVVLTISTMVHLFSYYYMENDLNSTKFISLISLFTFFMIILVSASNFFILFLGWEGVGLCSFLLISFWNSRLQAIKSALKAMLLNRFGDFFILMAISLIVLTFKSLDYYIIFSQLNLYTYKVFSFLNWNFSVIEIISFFLFIGCITKSAQLGLHGWLPDAMEGPTPVSALIHSATMVTAGIFLIMRCSFIFEFSTNIIKLMLYISILTILIFSFVGLYQNDIKKIIAYSTCSQLGYMMLACSLSGYNFSLFHLFNHAFFKALLFLCSGSIIHFMGNEQDLRRLSGIFKINPFVSTVFLIGLLSLIGTPFLSGYYSKELILVLIENLKTDNFILFFYVYFGVFLTTVYSIKLFYYLFIKQNFNNKINFLSVNNHHKNYYNILPLLILAILSIISGYMFKNLFISYGNNFFFGSLFTLNSNSWFYKEFFFNKLFPLFVIISAFLFFKIFGPIFNFYSNLLIFFNKRIFFDSIINLFISFFFYNLSYSIYILFDKGILELFGPFSISKIIFKLSLYTTKNFLSGYIFNYLILSFLFFLISLFFLI